MAHVGVYGFRVYRAQGFPGGAPFEGALGFRNTVWGLGLAHIWGYPEIMNACWGSPLQGL